MRYIKLFMIFIVSLLLVNTNVYAASSKFEPLISLEEEIIDDQVFVIVGYEGENVLALTQEISYENKYLDFVSVSPLADFDVTKGIKKDEGTFSTVKILADSSNKVYNDVKYAILVFNVKDAFKVGKSTTVFLYNYDSIGPNKDKYRHRGFEISIKRSGKNEVMFLKNLIDDSTKTRLWFREHLIIFIIVFVVIILVILFIFLIPSKTKVENRGKDIKKKIEKSANDSNSTIAPIKLDADLIASLGEEKKEVDMSEAIEVTDMKPFGEAIGKFDKEAPGSKLIDANADVFSINNSGIKDLETPTTEDGVEIFDEEEKNSDDDHIDTLGLFIIVLITSTLFIGTVKAIEYNVSELKENIVNNLSYKKELDYNDDGKIDLADLLETKDLSNLEYQDQEYDVPDYEPIEPIE